MGGLSLSTLTLGLNCPSRSLPAAALISSVDANGWSAQWRTGTPPTFTPDSSPSTFSVSRQGYTNTGSTTSYTETRTFTKRVRQAYPSQATPTPSTVSLSDYIYSTDSITGVTNNSTEISPTPIAQWGQEDRVVVGNTISGEIIAFHRDGRSGAPVACVIVTATDGTTTVSATVSSCTVSTSTRDACSVLVYAYSLNITTLNDNATITVNAKVYPWIGAAASLADSSTGTADNAGFVPQLFYKRTTRASTPYYCYVDPSAADDTSGVASTNAATAAASPRQTIGGAWKALRAAIGSADVDGCIVRLKTGTHVFGSGNGFNTYQNNGRNIIERDPASANRAAVVLQFGASNIGYDNIKYLLIRDLTISRQGNFSLTTSNGLPGYIALQDVSLDCATNGFKLTNARLYMLGGITLTNAAGTNAFNASSGQTISLFRGVTGGASSGALTVEGFNVLGCNLTNPIFTYLTTRISGSIVAFNKCMSSSNEVWSIGGASASGVAFVQNVIEFIGAGATPGPTFGPSRDSFTGNLTHLVVWHNTLAGANNAGRSNVLYDDGPNGNLRSHKLQSFVGNIHIQLNSKNDWFAGVISGLADASSHVGNWAYTHGVGCRAEFTQYQDAGPGQAYFRQDYPGLGASIGTSSTTRNDPLFNTYAATTYNGTSYTAGAGGGNYNLASGSPCASKVSASPLPYDLAGTARASTSAQGAYEYPF